MERMGRRRETFDKTARDKRTRAEGKKRDARKRAETIARETGRPYGVVLAELLGLRPEQREVIGRSELIRVGRSRHWPIIMSGDIEMLRQGQAVVRGTFVFEPDKAKSTPQRVVFSMSKVTPVQRNTLLGLFELNLGVAPFELKAVEGG